MNSKFPNKPRAIPPPMGNGSRLIFKQLET